MPRLFVLDAMNLAYRAYYALIRRPLVNSHGENTSAIYGMATLLLKIRREEKPDHACRVLPGFVRGQLKDAGDHEPKAGRGEDERRNELRCEC